MESICTPYILSASNANSGAGTEQVCKLTAMAVHSLHAIPLILSPYMRTLFMLYIVFRTGVIPIHQILNVMLPLNVLPLYRQTHCETKPIRCRTNSANETYVDVNDAANVGLHLWGWNGTDCTITVLQDGNRGSLIALNMFYWIQYRVISSL